MMTICVDCKFFSCHGDDIWYNHRCDNLQFARKKVIHPVTGKESFIEVNSLGQTYLSDEQAPNPRDINKGHCDGFAAKNQLETVRK